MTVSVGAGAIWEYPPVCDHACLLLVFTALFWSDVQTSGSMSFAASFNRV